MSVITMCPALILAARRKDRVIGRTEKLEDSTMTRNGLSHDGAPLGRSMATKFIGREKREERIILIQRVRPKEKVNKRWLVRLKVYGERLIRLKMIRNRKRHEVIAFQPRSFCARERASCLRIVFRTRSVSQVVCGGAIQVVVIRGHRIRAFRSQNILVRKGRLEVAISGSKEVKLSVNISGGG